MGVVTENAHAPESKKFLRRSFKRGYLVTGSRLRVYQQQILAHAGYSIMASSVPTS
jgi:hypothetical protein